jgi:hypothetical protein
MLIILIAIVPAVFYIQYRFRSLPRNPSLKSQSLSKELIIKASIISFVIGGYDGLFGPGTGTFLLAAFLVALQMESLEAAANARVVNYASNLAAFGYFAFHGAIHWHLAALCATSSLIGNWIGSGFAINKGDSGILPVFRFVLGLLLAKCAYDLFVILV